MMMNIKRAFAMVAFLLLFYVCGMGWRYILVDDTSAYSRIMMHEIYESPTNIDTIFVGSSHVYRTIVPSIMDEALDCYTFNAGSSAQAMDGSFAMIKEIDKYHDLRHVYLEVYCGIAVGVNNEERETMTATYIVSDYMRPSMRKVDYLLNASSKKHWINSFIVARRNWTYFFNADYVKNLVIKKSSDDYKSYVWTKKEDATEYYVERGFVANEGIIQEGKYWTANSLEPISTSKIQGSDWEKSLIEVIEYCKRNNIEITLFVAPEPEWTIVAKQNYQDYYQFLQEFADENEVELYDFNLCSREYFDATDRSLFLDVDHLNALGAEVFSELAGKVFAGELEKGEVFYNTYNEKLENETALVYGVAGPFDSRECKILSNRESGIEYKIVAKTSDGKEYCIQDFSENNIFSMPQDESGTLTVIWRTIDNPEEYKMFDAQY